MPRTRINKEDNWLPTRVYLEGKSYIYRPKNSSAVTLCKLPCSPIDVLTRHKQESDKLTCVLTFQTIINEFFESADFRVLSTETRKDYLSYSTKIGAVFGKMKPLAVEPKHVRLFMDELGRNSIFQANRHKACMQKICSWALERGKIKINPCVGVQKFKEPERERYITHEEYKAIYLHASIACQVAMEIAYLCSARISDVISLQKNQIHDSGLFIKQQKTKVKQIKAWTPRLRDAVDRGLNMPLKPGKTSIFVIHKPNGDKFAKRTIQSHFTDAKELALSSLGFSSIEDMDIHFHDLKAKGGSDMEGTLNEVSHALGHTSLEQTRTYIRKVDVVDSVQNPAPINR